MSLEQVEAERAAVLKNRHKLLDTYNDAFMNAPKGSPEQVEAINMIAAALSHDDKLDALCLSIAHKRFDAAFELYRRAKGTPQVDAAWSRVLSLVRFGL